MTSGTLRLGFVSLKMFLNLVEGGVPSREGLARPGQSFRFVVSCCFLILSLSNASRPLTVSLGGVFNWAMLLVVEGRRLDNGRVFPAFPGGGWVPLSGGSGGSWSGGLSVILEA